MTCSDAVWSPAHSIAHRQAILDGEIAALAAQCGRVQAWLSRRINHGQCGEAEAARYLSILSEVSGDLAAILARRAALQ